MFERETRRTMNKHACNLMIAVALTLPSLALSAQPENGSRERPDRDRAQQRDRPEERERQTDRPGNRERPVRPGLANREPISVEQVDQAIATLRAVHPDDRPAWIERIERLAQTKPQDAAKRLSRYPRLRELMEAREHRPAEFALKAQESRTMREVFPIVKQIRRARQQDDQAGIDRLRPQLRERIESLVVVRLKLKELEIQRIREQLQKAEQDLDEIEADRDALVDEKLEELIERGGRPGDDDQPRRPRPDRSPRGE